MIFSDSARNGSAPDDDPGADDVPVDPDFVLLSDYLDGDLTSDQNAAFEARCDSDARFWDKIGPVLMVIGLTITPDPDAAAKVLGLVPVCEVSRSWSPSVEGSWASPGPVLVATTKPAAKRRWKPSWKLSWHRTSNRTSNRTSSRAWKRTLLVGGLYAAAGLVFCGWFITTKAAPLTVNSFFRLFHHQPASTADSPLIAQYRLDLKRGWSSEEATGPLIQDTTGPGQTRRVDLPRGMIVTLRPNSRFAYASSPSTTKQLLSIPARATVDGEAVLDINDVWRIHTRTAILILSPGMYAIRCIPFSTQTQINVGNGKAVIYRAGNKGSDSVVAVSGDNVLIPLTGRMRVTPDSTGFPLFGGDPPAAVAPSPGRGGPPARAPHQ